MYNSRVKPGESPEHFVVMLIHYLKRWVDLTMIEQSCEGLRQLIVREQFLQECLKDLAVFPREKPKANLIESTRSAENYLQARGIK